jgi:multidrug efflux system outer membrane protein
MNSRNILLGVVITFMAGCSFAPSYERPSLPTAAVYPGANTAQTQVKQDALQLGWREFFTEVCHLYQ